MATCENCGHQNCGFAQYAARYGAETGLLRPARLRADCERRAKERALAEVARLTATIARVREACNRKDVVRMFGGVGSAVAISKNKLRDQFLALLEGA